MQGEKTKSVLDHITLGVVQTVADIETYSIAAVMLGLGVLSQADPESFAGSLRRTSPTEPLSIKKALVGWPIVAINTGMTVVRNSLKNAQSYPKSTILRTIFEHPCALSLFALSSFAMLKADKANKEHIVPLLSMSLLLGTYLSYSWAQKVLEQKGDQDTVPE